MNNSGLLDASVTCLNCELESSLQEVVCPKCKIPLVNDFKENNRFSREDRDISHRLLDIDTQINKARMLLFFVSGITLIQHFFFMTVEEGVNGSAILIEGAIISLIYFVFAWFVPKFPRVCFIGGLLTYLTLRYLAYLINPATLTSSMLFKVIVIGGLSHGILNAFWAVRIKDKLRARV